MGKYRKQIEEKTKQSRETSIAQIVGFLCVLVALAYVYRDVKPAEEQKGQSPDKRRGSSLRQHILKEPLTVTVGYRVVNVDKADPKIKQALENLRTTVANAEKMSTDADIEDYIDPYEALNELEEYGDLIKGHIAPPVGTTGVIGEKPISSIGETGGATILPKDMSATAQAVYGEGWHKNYFNQLVSDLIPWTRSIPDGRNYACKKKTRYLPIKDLPKTGIIICFINEAWSTLMRTVHNILLKTPPELLSEIVLVDDNSDLVHLQYPLEALLSHPFYEKVKLVRCDGRQGLIRARMIGLEQITAPVVTFLDSHIELGNNWLVPLLDRIARDPTVVANPIIDAIDMNTFQYIWINNKDLKLGIFDWNLQFMWRLIPPRIRKIMKEENDPYISPTMAGGIFAIDVEFFKKLGLYDPGFDYWGGDNLELSFKVWMCGGSIEMFPCSHVGHVFRDQNPYKFENYSSNFDALNHNMARVAEVWMDEYKELYFNTLTEVPYYGDVQERKELRNELQCKSFQWYLEHIYPEMFLPQRDALSKGKVSIVDGLCWATAEYAPYDMQPLILEECNAESNLQSFMLGRKQEIHREDVWCIDYEVTINTLVVFKCDNNGLNQRWLYNPKFKSIKHGVLNRCVTANKNEMKPELATCNVNDVNQQWDFENFKPATGAKSEPATGAKSEL